MKIVVIGGTGLVGSKVVDILGAKGHEAIAAAPNTGVNTLTGEGLAEALTGADVVVDVSNSPSFDDRTAMDFFTTSGRNITAAEKAARIKHHLALSVVGTDRLQASGYFRAKQAQENQIAASGIPYTILHATQFFEFIRAIAQSATKGDRVYLPDILFQPMAAKDVAGFVAEAVMGAPQNATVEVAGPEKFRLDELTARVLAFDRDPRQVITDPDAPYYGLKIDDETLLPGHNARLGATHFDWWLLNVPPPPRATAAPTQDRTPARV
jgi:uncharacterized protein YbjT (DUF2867 family)